MSKNTNNGFTLVESVVVVGISTFVLVGITQAIVFFYNTNDFAVEQAAAITETRNGITAMVQDIREATYSEIGAYPVVEMSDDMFSFYADTDRDDTIELVRFFRDDNELHREVSNADEMESSAVVSDNVRNDSDIPVFRYFDENGERITNFEDIGAVRFVTLELAVNVDPANAPETTSLRSSATLRNLNRSS